MKENLTKSSIIEQSWKLLQQEGTSGFSMRKLAKCVDVSVSSLYYHYESKEALFHDMIDQACKKVIYPIDEKEWDMRLIKYAENILNILNEYDQLAQLLMIYPPMSSNYGKLMDNLLKVIEGLNLSDSYKLYTINYYLNYIFTFKLDNQNVNSNKKQGEGFSECDTPYLFKYKKEGLFEKLGSREMFEFGLSIFINGIKSFEKNL